MSSGRARRDFLDARDVGSAIAAIAASSAVGAINVASGAQVSLKQIGETIADLAGRRDLLQIGALPDRSHEPEILAADVARLQAEVGFRPRISFEQGLRDALACWSRDRR
jgi:UDP-glucose 4-epimerase